uniref:Uncharacterized protein n=1 Tax=Anguilla anguilla TaxID=7936 RepID=A0A0E9VQ05_ANGAN
MQSILNLFKKCNYLLLIIFAQSQSILSM